MYKLHYVGKHLAYIWNLIQVRGPDPALVQDDFAAVHHFTRAHKASCEASADPGMVTSCKNCGFIPVWGDEVYFLTEPVPSTNFHNGSKHRLSYDLGNNATHTIVLMCSVIDSFIMHPTRPI